MDPLHPQHLIRPESSTLELVRTHRSIASESAVLALERSSSLQSSLSRASSRSSWSGSPQSSSWSVNSHTNLLSAAAHPSGHFRRDAGPFYLSDNSYREKDLPPIPSQPPVVTLLHKVRHYLSPYRRLFFLVVLLNLIGVSLAATKTWTLPRRKPSAFVVGNVFVSVALRSEWVLRFIFWVVVKLFRKWPPLTVRALIVAVLYHIGGVHSGCGVAAFIWLFWATYNNYTHSQWYNPAIQGTMGVCLISIGISCLTALPIVRGRHHNTFELNHRIFGWIGVLATWAFILLNAFWDVSRHAWDVSFSRVVWRQEFWLNAGITVLVIAAWITVAEVPVTITAPTRKTSIIKFNTGLTSGVHTRVSRGGLREWHVFGSVSAGKKSGCHYIVMAVQGEFTASINRDLPKTLYTRRWKLAGLPYFSRLFNKGVAICTGSGIGAVGSTCLQHENWFLVWIGGDLEEGYGEVYDLIKKGTAGRSILWDTRERGRPDVVTLLEETYRAWDAEVALFIGSPAMNKDVLRSCKARGIPAFGSIWDA